MKRGERMLEKRAAGLLLHVTSLPAPHGIGDIGAVNRYLLPFLKETEQSYWQILPIHPVGYGHSPYQSYSAFAGNELLIDPEGWVESGLLVKNELEAGPGFSETAISFEEVGNWKSSLYRKAFERFKKQAPPSDYKQFADRNSFWLTDYCLFSSMKKKYNQQPWHKWPVELVNRDPVAIRNFSAAHEDEIAYTQFLQFTFHTQWKLMKQGFDQAGIQIIGDLPIFVAHDSADVWADQQLFRLNSKGYPEVIAGVPPDYFSETGQRWGNPHYRWDRMQQGDFLWWRKRIEHLLESVDLIRVDHFRGFEAYWEIKSSEPTAVGGRWVKAPGAALFHSLKKHLGTLPLIAEDLGVITPEVEALKRQFGFPGMKILQFSFGRKLKKRERPAYYEKHTFAYTGTHDNDTLVGWLTDKAIKDKGIRENLEHHYQIDPEDPETACSQLIELLLKTSAGAAVIPLQDYLALGTEARMNYPGTIGGSNWRWRCTKAHLRDAALMQKILKMTRESGRS
jgi:4-alpha-glucanotransferase